MYLTVQNYKQSSVDVLASLWRTMAVINNSQVGTFTKLQ